MNELNEKEYAQAIIVGSYVLYLLSLMDKEQQTKATTIRLRDKLAKVTTSAKNAELVLLSNECWNRVLEKHKEDNLLISQAITIESLYFSFIDIMNKLYGSQLGNLICSYVNKQSKGDISNYAKDSYKAADSLRDELRKIIFEHFKK